MLTILVVEDNALNRDMLSRRLQMEGYKVETAINGLQAIETARTLLPDLILMDLDLPVINGWEATKTLKADTVTLDIPVIALTAHAFNEDRKQAIEAGCDDYDTKPVDFPRLQEKMQALLEGEKLRAITR
ncbi:MAG: response regulator [Gammaproteobacteria bacterium]|nr:response regulator [Gammaproteobacteria bacterium]